MRQIPQGSFSVGNASARKEELKDRLTQSLEADSLEPQIAESLRSQLLFADAQIFFGRFSKISLRSIGRVAMLRNDLSPLTWEVRTALEWFGGHVLTGAPRSISCVDRETYLLFLGGAFSEPSSSDEWSGVSIGAALTNGHGRPVERKVRRT